MAIPAYEELMRPLLNAYKAGTPRPMNSARAQLAAELHLTRSGEEYLPSGTAAFMNRLGWAAFYLSKVMALDRVRRGTISHHSRG